MANTNRGALFANNRKTDGDNRPDMTGNIEIEGTKYRLAAWKNVSDKDVAYISLIAEEEGTYETKSKSSSEEKVPF